MIRYKSIEVTIPTYSEKTETILTTSEGQKINIKMFGKPSSSEIRSLLKIDGDLVVDIPSNMYVVNADFIPVDIMLEGVHEVKVGGKSLVNYDITVPFCIAYEEVEG